MNHGEHWSAIQSDTEELIEQLLPVVLQEGKLGRQSRLPVPGPDDVVRVEELAELLYGDGPLRFAALVATDSSQSSETRYLYASFPMCWEGTTCSISFLETQHSDDGVEAVVSGNYGGADGGLLWFYDAHYFAHKETYHAEQQYDFILAGLAYLFRPVTQDAITVTEGDMLKVERERVLRENPHADPNEVKSVSISLEDARILMPQSDHPENCEFMTKVEHVERFEIVGLAFYRIICEFMPEAETRLLLPIYVSEETLGEYQPKIGDRVEGVMWLQGRLAG